MNKHRSSYHIILILLLTVSACKSAKTSSVKNGDIALQQLSIGNISDTSNKIIFFSFEVALTDSVNEAYSFKLINKTVTEGVLKKNNLNATDNPEQGYFYCEFSDDKHNRIDLIQAENPLNKIYEYPADNSNALGKQMIAKETGTVFLRFQNNNAKYLSIYKLSSVTNKLKTIYYAQLLP